MVKEKKTMAQWLDGMTEADWSNALSAGWKSEGGMATMDRLRMTLTGEDNSWRKKA